MAADDSSQTVMEVLGKTLWHVFFRYWIHFLLWPILTVITYSVLKKVAVPYLWPFYKKMFRVRRRLAEMKALLESDYADNYWDSHQFCKAYLELYSAYRELRATAKRDHKGNIDAEDGQWAEFDEIVLRQRDKKAKRSKKNAGQKHDEKVKPTDKASKPRRTADRKSKPSRKKASKPPARGRRNLLVSIAEKSFGPPLFAVLLVP
ncbi:Protein R06A10.5 b [Aphelenchoides avenae]|nr:Protein R06A10.5 b [Aphelenchus avenae]